MLGHNSLNESLTVGPRFTGSPHGSLTVSRVVTQMSGPPDPPDRLDGLQHPRLGVDVVDVLREMGERDRPPVPHPAGGRRELASQQGWLPATAGVWLPNALLAGCAVALFATNRQ